MHATFAAADKLGKSTHVFAVAIAGAAADYHWLLFSFEF